MRDEIFAKQLAVLRQEGDERSSLLDSQRRGNSTGHYSPALLPPLDSTASTSLGASRSRSAKSKRPHAFGSAAEDMVGSDRYRRYDSKRVREGHANQAIADYYDSVQNQLYGMPAGF